MGSVVDVTIHGNNNSGSYYSTNLTKTTGPSVNAAHITATVEAGALSPGVQAVVSALLGLLILGTILGNTLVCTAVSLAKRLQSPSNLLIVSLAVSDLLVAVLVMPLAAVYEVTGFWPFSDLVCDFWTSLDVIMCTASILNLCMISIDRYFVITKPLEYAAKRSPKRMALMIAAAWCLSVIISVPPLFGWRPERVPNKCIISQEIGYQIYATLGAFYVPLLVMIIIYFRIWKISSRILKKDRAKLRKWDKNYDAGSSFRSSVQSDSPIYKNGSVKNGLNNNESLVEIIPKQTPSKRVFTFRSILSRDHRKRKKSGHTDRRATKTLGIIMGGFTLCWLPFFILAVLRPFIGHAIPYWLSSCLMWLGYFNSFLNPLIYARFNREFRSPFKEILCCRCHGVNKRLRSESYVEQYGPDHIYRDRDRDSIRIEREPIVRRTSLSNINIHIANGHLEDIRESIV